MSSRLATGSVRHSAHDNTRLPVQKLLLSGRQALTSACLENTKSLGRGPDRTSKVRRSRAARRISGLGPSTRTVARPIALGGNGISLLTDDEFARIKTICEDEFTGNHR